MCKTLEPCQLKAAAKILSVRPVPQITTSTSSGMLSGKGFSNPAKNGIEASGVAVLDSTLPAVEEARAAVMEDLLSTIDGLL
ncbi:hypothetical protein WICPIJ_001093 [Wickerhamomyces pijperi]|uniref:Uncharacterized protein n=1 Tax=Wickerhamomyces pijperi TaxID=599730 RepID=A0A9P8QCA1_WICPI|nr:hypothetical protein WICPIJ_001093 [Wickerhamomyces pijperi]